MICQSWLLSFTFNYVADFLGIYRYFILFSFFLLDLFKCCLSPTLEDQKIFSSMHVNVSIIVSEGIYI